MRTMGPSPRREAYDTMDLEKLKSELKDETFGQLKAYVEELTGQRDAARAESIDGRKKMKSELEQLRQVRATLFEKLGIDDDADLDALPEPKGQAEAIKQFEQKLKRLEREKADALAKASDIEGKWKASRLDAALARAVSAHEFIDSDLVSSHFRSQAQFEDDQIMVKAGDKIVSLEDGVKLFAQTKPHLLKAQGRSGSGHPPGAGSAGGKTSITRAELEAMSPVQRLEVAKAGTAII